MTSAIQQHDLLMQQLAVAERRIDRHLDNQDRRLFMIACQHRAQIKARLLALAYELAAEEDEVEAA